MPATSPTIAQLEREIIAAEGHHHVHGQYFADLSVAATARRRAAERAGREHKRAIDYVARRGAELEGYR